MDAVIEREEAWEMDGSTGCDEVCGEGDVGGEDMDV